MERRQEEVPTAPSRVTAASDVTVERYVARATRPSGIGRPEHGIDRGPFGRGRERPDHVQVHRRSVPGRVPSSGGVRAGTARERRGPGVA